MKKYKIYAKETIYYTYELEANNDDEAHDAVADGHVDPNPNLTDSENFEIQEIEEVTE